VGFDDPSFEIRINAASRVILNPAVQRFPAFQRKDYKEE
jgi:hypothetical protein